MTYVIRAMLKGENVWFLGLRGKDATWTSHKPEATTFSVLEAANDTAEAIRVGVVEILGATGSTADEHAEALRVIRKHIASFGCDHVRQGLCAKCHVVVARAFGVEP